MKVENFYGHPIIRIQCEDESIYRNEMFLNSVEMTYKSPVVQNRVRKQIGDSHKGAGLTTVGQPYPLVSLPGSSTFVEWVSQQLLDARELLGLANKGKEVYYKRSWSNRLFRGGYGLCHQHLRIDNYIKELTGYSDENFAPDATAVFYLDVPEGSSNIVFIKDGEDDTPVEQYSKEDTYWLKPNEGELVIFLPDLCHAVSTHNSDLPRNVFVFDFDYV
jgi:hypothetical protein